MLMSCVASSLMNGKTVVITGGTGGIGLQTAISLARLNAHIVIVGRNAERGAAAETQIIARSGNTNIVFVPGDLASLSSVHALTEKLLAAVPQVDVLINNAGLFSKTFIESPDGFESSFAVNVVATLALTRGLLPALEAATLARVVNVSGGAPSKGLDIENLNAEKGFDGLNTYSHAKRAMEAMSLAITAELRGRGVYLNIVYPGQASTSMTQSVASSDMPWYVRPMWPLISRMMQKDDGGASAATASRSSVWAATSEELEGVSGKYFDTKCREKALNQSVQDADNQQQVLACAEGRSQANHGSSETKLEARS